MALSVPMATQGNRCLPVRRRSVRSHWIPGLFALSVAFTLGGCTSPGARARLAQDNQALKLQVERLERSLQARDTQVASLERQVDTLKGFGADRPIDLFAPVRIEIVSRSGGQDYDGRPGDDGVTLYIRPLDADGDVVKVPGRITVQLLNLVDLEEPHVVGVYHFTDPAVLRRSWYGKLGTMHYTLKCPFPAGVVPPRTLGVRVEFTDFSTGKTLTASVDFTIEPASSGG